MFDTGIGDYCVSSFFFSGGLFSITINHISDCNINNSQGIAQLTLWKCV